ncbi:MAG: efflux transporter periplasmic adaptor subunit [Sphingomonas bacterium]|uniref:efflux RND transporter periplasmic adaptor subunit n=1 Tax=Sphingomonas bacterium TaxID=1895847 RepID=UPI0026309B0D|nr:efflux RND transporter periplasmic adaptor subunit [Sphingomonas bacterium]MDB5705551.1 efflux transporter periplasmic adaptor subunit [Sphingomonas bacterium]
MKLLGLAALLVLAGCSAAEETPETTPTALVTLAPAQSGAVDEDLTLYGAVENGAFGRNVLAAPAEATVVSIDAPVGSTVGRGQVVARLSASPATRLDLAKAQTDAQAANQALARAQRLRADGLVSDADVETARAAARSANVTRASLSGRSGALVLRAPAAGHVELIGFAPGDLVPAGGAVATISASGTMRARFGLDPALAGKIHPGTMLRITTSAGAAPFSAPAVSVDPVVDAQTRLASVFVSVPPGSGIGAGATLTAHVALAGGGGGLTIPYDALLDDAGQPYVFVVKGGVAHRRDVTIGAVGGDRVTVLKGVAPGEPVVTAGGTALEDGMKVRTK